MRPLSVALLVLLIAASLFYAQSKNINNVGFVLAVVVGLIGAAFVLDKRFAGSESGGQVLLGLAVSIIIAAASGVYFTGVSLIGVSLISGAIAGVAVFIAFKGRFK